ncbi:uncharacterized protein IAS62_001991 [Cryptococcus decagattii]|uniref:Uncharacterized protein n=1 Tax=Cryptococcus decagattii TaxID=1859122 RepID=A0ABZ2AQB7_9TREE
MKRVGLMHRAAPDIYSLMHSICQCHSMLTILQIFRVVVTSVIVATYYAPRQYVPVARIEKLPNNEAVVTTRLNEYHRASTTGLAITVIQQPASSSTKEEK